MKKSSEQLKVPVPASSSYLNSPAWYLRERVPVQTVQDRRTRKYFALEERVNADGFKGEVLVQKDYPYTPEYVSSLFRVPCRGRVCREKAFGAGDSCPDSCICRKGR